MSIRRNLVALTLVVGTAVATAGAASPGLAAGSNKTADDKGSQVLVLDNLKLDTTMAEMQKSAEKIVGQPLAPVSQVTVVKADKNELTSEQIKALLAGKEPPGVTLLGEAENPKPTTTLADVANVSDPIRVEGGFVILYAKCTVFIYGDSSNQTQTNIEVCVVIPFFVPDV